MASGVRFVNLTGQLRQFDLFNLVELFDLVDDFFVVFLQCLQVSNQVPALFFCENLVEARHSGARNAFGDAVEPHFVRVLFEERSREVGWFLLD